MLLQASQLSEFFEICRGLHYGQGQKYLKIKPVLDLKMTWHASAFVGFSILCLMSITCTFSAPGIIPDCYGGLCEGGSRTFGTSIYSSMMPKHFCPTEQLSYSALREKFIFVKKIKKFAVSMYIIVKLDTLKEERNKQIWYMGQDKYMDLPSMQVFWFT